MKPDYKLHNKPKAAPLPTKPGLYWLRVARVCYDPKRSWDDGGPFYWPEVPEIRGWFLAEVNLNEDTDYNIAAYLGSDSIGKWEDDEEVVVVVGPLVEEPK